MTAYRVHQLLRICHNCYLKSNEASYYGSIFDFRYVGYDGAVVAFQSPDGVIHEYPVEDVMVAIGEYEPEPFKVYYDRMAALLPNDDEPQPKAAPKLIERTPIEIICIEIANQLPHGSGINSAWHIGRVRMLNESIGVVMFYNSYEQDSGYGISSPLDFGVSYAFDTANHTAKFRDILCNAKEHLVQFEDGEFDDLDNTLDYLWQCFADTEIKL